MQQGHGIVIFDGKAAVCDAYIAGRNVMVVGDGDFSFSKEVMARAARASRPRFFCTSVLPSAQNVIKRHLANKSSIADNLAWFDVAGIQY